jgi:hypothetical protein
MALDCEPNMRSREVSTAERVAKYGFLAGATLVGGAVVLEVVATALGVTLPGWAGGLVWLQS